MTLDRNRFLFLAAAIGAASCTTSSNPTPDAGPQVTPDGSTPDTSTASDSGTADTSTTADAGKDAATEASAEAGACDDDTGQTGKAKYCPLSETGAGCIDLTDCENDRFKAGSELRFFDCLAGIAAGSCVTETGPDPRVACATDMVAHACQDTDAKALCAQVVADCGDAGDITLADCVKYVSPLSEGARTAISACVSESGCSAQALDGCVGYLPLP